jgi:hypothetical protein
MSVSPHPLLSEVRPKTYFVWSGKLWYVMDVAKDQEMAFVEDCKTLKVRWIEVEKFKNEMKEVKL